MCCFTLFNLQGTRSCSPLSRTAYIYYHKLFRLSTSFFIFLCKPEFAKIKSKLFPPEANLFIILRCSWFVKHFFLPVIQLLRFIWKKKRSSSELDYYTMPSTNCQVLFIKIGRLLPPNLWSTWRYLKSQQPDWKSGTLPIELHVHEYPIQESNQPLYVRGIVFYPIN